MTKSFDGITLILSGKVEVVEHLGNQNIGIRIKTVGEFIPLIVQIAFNLKFDRLSFFGAESTTAQLATKFLAHQLIGKIGNMAEHTS